MNRSPLAALLRFCLDNPLVMILLTVGAIAAGLMTAPFARNPLDLPRAPVPVDALPDLGENQQIVFTEWTGHSPRDVEDQVTYPLTVALMGLPQVRTVRSTSMFGFSSVSVIFADGADFYDSRSRILEKLASLPPGALPAGVSPALGPDATALGQVFWYTLEGRDADGNPAGGWDPDELRGLQDWYVRYALAGAEGVAEVASVGGFVREYQVDVDPDALRHFGVTLAQVTRAVQASNQDVGARTLEVNGVEYVVRGLGFVRDTSDLEQAVVTVRDGVAVTVGDVAVLGLGPAPRRGALDKEGAEAVGGVVVARYGANPLQTIENVKAAIAELAPGLPSRTLDDGRVSKVTVVPFYDRSGLIHETLDTLDTALTQEILITVIVVLVMIANLRSGVLIAGLLPLAVLLSFVGMKAFGVDANVVALSGIAIAIGTMVDMGIVLTENIVRHLDEAPPGTPRRDAVLAGATEVGGAVLTSVATTVVSFLPVFTLQGAEGKLFRPLAATKTFALVAAVIVALALIPPFARLLWRGRTAASEPRRRRLPWALNVIVVLVVLILLSADWLPFGPARGLPLNVLGVGLALGLLLLASHLFVRIYPRLLRWCLDRKAAFLLLPGLLMLLGLTAWRGFDGVFGRLPGAQSALTEAPRRWFPGLGREFMPPLDEGSYLYMPTTMPHASIGEAMDALRKIDAALAGVPEVEQVVGKIGRVESALDPAPVSMIETVVSYKDEYRIGPDGRPVRQWRDQIRTADDIWDELTAAARLPGTTSAPRLQPIAARQVMLQSGLRAPMGVKVRGPDLESIDTTARAIEALLKTVPEVRPATVTADRVVGKPYLEIDLDREALARRGVTVGHVQEIIATAVGGRTATTTVEGRERYGVRVRLQRERRDTPEDLAAIPVDLPGGGTVPLGELARVEFVRGPQALRSEDTFLLGYVLFDKREGLAETDAVLAAKARLDQAVADGELVLPRGVSYAFAGTYENQVRAQKRLSVVLPAALGLIFLILYLQFRSTLTTLMVFSGVFVAWSGGFVLLWLYGQDWFLHLPLLGDGLRELLQIRPVNLSVAVWVGFLALFGIATDDGVVMATYLKQAGGRGRDRAAIRDEVVAAASRRVRPAMMTTATTILALLPVLTSTGRGSDIMLPMAIPAVGGMAVEILTVLVVPVLDCLRRERAARS